MDGLVTVCNEEYLQGTKVLFYSFLRHNKEFLGDLIVIHNGLAKQQQEELLNLFPICFVQVSEPLNNAIEQLVLQKSELKNRYQRFWSLEIFRLNQYDNLLFLDSDILCRGSLNSLFNLNRAISACPDISFYENKSRNRLSFTKVEREESTNSIKTCFNAGVIAICFSKLSNTVFENLLSMVDHTTFSKIKSGHTDQYILNLYFEKEVTFLDATYNYGLSNSQAIVNKTGLLYKDAKLLHYTRHPKPWKLKQVIKKRIKGQRDWKAWNEWHKIYRTVLKQSNKDNLKIKNLIYALLSKVLFP